MQTIITMAEISDNIVSCLVNIIILTVKVDMSTNLESELELCRRGLLDKLLENA